MESKQLKSALPLALAGAIILFGVPQGARADGSNRIYGTIRTFEGDTFEGFIRWDKNEGCWDDVLDGNKERPKLDSRGRSRRKYGDRERNRSFWGIGIEFSGSTAQSGIAFGHIQKMRPLDDNAVLLILKSGEEIELEGGSTDIGDDTREIVIEDKVEGEIELEWEDIDEVELSQADPNLESNFGERLWGSVKTRRGDEFTGFISWDVDESFEDDVLDGYERGRKRKIRFRRIEAIERHGSGAALVRTKDGKEIRLEDTNDVDDSNSGIVVSDPDLGRIVIEWDEFDVVEFSSAPRKYDYSRFDGGKPIYGTVFTDEGDSFTGEIIWDEDEMYGWEILDGVFHRVDLDIFFSHISSIERDRRGATVTLKDGREFYLRDSNDIDDGNKGIFVRTADEGVEEIDWDYFERLELQ